MGSRPRVVLFAWASYTLLNVNYAYFAVFLTAYVVFLLSLAGVSQQPLVMHHVLFTAMGGALALGMHALSAHREQLAGLSYSESDSRR
jgi:uncharacterized membrane protein YccC